MVDIKIRKEVLIEKLDKVNEWIGDTIRDKITGIETECKFNYMGIILPFEEGDDLNPRMVVKIISNLALPFNTKKRAPFRIVFETVTLNEIKGRNINLLRESLRAQENVEAVFDTLQET
jgi:hypothetical protein